MTLKPLFERDDVYIYPFYIADLVLTKDFKKLARTCLKKSFSVFSDGYVKNYYDLESANEVGKNLFDRIINDKDFYSETITNIYKYSDELTAFCAKIAGLKNISALTDEELINIYQEYMTRLSALRLWGWVPPALDGIYINYLSDHIQAEFEKYLQKIGKQDRLIEYYSILSSSEKMSDIQAEELARLDLLLKIMERAEGAAVLKDIQTGEIADIKNRHAWAYDLLNDHVGKFGWLPYAYVGPMMTMDYLLILLDDNLESGDIRVQKNGLLAHYEEVSKQKKEIIKELDLPGDLQYIFNVSAEFMYIKDYRKGVYQKSYVVMDPILQELAGRIGITLREVKFLVFNDIKDALLNGREKHYQKIARDRSIKSCYIVQNGEIDVYEGEKCEELISKMVVEEDAKVGSVSEIKGKTAYGGVVRGKVKIVLVEGDVQKVEKGDILVSSATNPNLILAMKRAAAFVTDTGGIISHAAIVSRELKKPCIVGTGNATHVLKDGDEVEVDADHGVVRLIKKT